MHVNKEGIENECEHDMTKEECYPQQHYFTMSVVKVKTCIKCGEILSEDAKQFKG